MTWTTVLIVFEAIVGILAIVTICALGWWAMRWLGES